MASQPKQAHRRKQSNSGCVTMFRKPSQFGHGLGYMGSRGRSKHIVAQSDGSRKVKHSVVKSDQTVEQLRRCPVTSWVK